MRRKEEKNSIIEICPVRNVIARFGNKWAMLVVLVMNENGNNVRFNELLRLIPDISSRVLSSTLKTLEADGLVARKAYAEVPPKVEYSLTETGLSLVPIILELTACASTTNFLSSSFKKSSGDTVVTSESLHSKTTAASL